jgi:short subunit dehydrogenase-like uncharacterized protein
VARIVVFGATGFTGGQVARALAAAGVEPVLAGRDRDRLFTLADELGTQQIVVVDAERPDGTVRRALEPGDVLVSTVGPFLRFGAPAVHAALGAGAHYLDSTGEPPFIRWVLEGMDAPARGDVALVPAFGYDFVPGNLAGALALREAGDAAVRVDIGYFSAGPDGGPAMTEGTARSAAGVVLEPAFAWRDGRLVTVRGAERVRSFPVGERELDGISVGGSEHLGLPAVAPGLREVNVHLGWFGPLSRAVQRASPLAAAASSIPGARWLVRAVGGEIAARRLAGTRDDPPSLGGSHVVAIAYDEAGGALAEVHLEGPDGYAFTAAILAWGARRAATAGPETTGAHGPVAAFGIDALESGCAEAGLRRVPG